MTPGVRPEVLAPAGSWESLEAAVRSGADAVYLGGALFSARAGAKNFDDEELQRAVEYCRARNVKVHLAVNTLLRDAELPRALSFLSYACTLPVDAVLVQDAGLLWFLRRCAPELPLHASTQMSIHTPAGVRALSQAGFVRAVLSREMSLAELKAAGKAAPDMETEAFVHGALCMSVSGQCYFSALLGSRSGNRGMCAQPCRLPFSAPGGTGYDLSLKDLSLISRMDELAAAGVYSMKIEGRLKRPEYVAAATRACRLAADGQDVPPELERQLEAVFSRSGFTGGYADGSLGRAMFGVRRKEDAAAGANVFSQLHSLYQKELPRVPLTLSLRVCAGEPIALEAADAAGARVRVDGCLPESAQNRPLTGERCREQLQKTGGTPFFVKEIHCDLGAELSVPVSELNRLRRQALEQLLEQRKTRAPISFSREILHRAEEALAVSHAAPKGELSLRAHCYSAGQVPENAASCELVYLPCTTRPEDWRVLSARGVSLGVEIPRGMFGMENTIRNQLELAKACGVSHAWAGNLGAAQLAKEVGFTVHGGFSLNVLNTAALCWYGEFGLADTELSPEITLQQAAALGGALPRGLLLYGRLPLMLCRNCPAANACVPVPGQKPCLNCKTAPLLTDRRGVQFPLQCRGACTEVLNSVPLYFADRLAEAKNVEFASLRFTTESRAQAGELLGDYLRGEPRHRPEAGAFTRGLLYRGIE